MNRRQLIKGLLALPALLLLGKSEGTPGLTLDEAMMKANPVVVSPHDIAWSRTDSPRTWSQPVVTGGPYTFEEALARSLEPVAVAGGHIPRGALIGIDRDGKAYGLMA